MNTIRKGLLGMPNAVPFDLSDERINATEKWSKENENREKCRNGK